MPAEKYAHAGDRDYDDPFDLPNICFMGANVVSGFGRFWCKLPKTGKFGSITKPAATFPWPPG
jgi:hypothetical protein